MAESVNIAAMSIASQVQRHVTASYYAIQLTELQVIAKRFGYFFARANTTAFMPAIVFDCLARGLEYRRQSYLYPLMAPGRLQQRTSWNMEDGYAQEYLVEILGALVSLGLRLQESPEALALVTAEESRQREDQARVQADVNMIVQDFLSDIGADCESI